MNITNFEVYAFSRERGWVLHARFSGQEREDALAEAKEVERMGMRARVSREVYNTEENSYDETDIYVGRAPDNAAASSGPKKVGGNRMAAPSAAHSGSVSPKKSKRRSKKSENAPKESLLTSRALPLIAFVILMSILGGLVTVHFLPDMINLAWKLGYRIDLSADNYESLVLSAFAATFMVLALPLSVIMMPKMFGRKQPLDAAGSEQSLQFTVLQEARRQKMKASLDDLSRSALMEEEFEAMASQAETPPEAEQPVSDAAPSADQPPPPPPPPVEDDQPQSLAATEAAVKLRTFVDSAISAIKNTRTQLDNYNKFALHLYIAGAVEILGNNRNLVAAERRQLTANALSNLGTSKDMAGQFYDKVSDYVVEERYHKMVEHGRDAMGDFLKGAEASAHSQLTGAIQEWSRGSANQAGAPTVTVMFTDMVGSTDMTQDRGDVAAQEIVRRHNTIVRMAISQYGGKEIKHTGDGIMASFDDCTGAVDASISIQRNVSNHNKARPDQPLHLRIGLNTGKPIQEENDIFGATVQLAARVCAATKPEQTLCTESVVARSRGRSEFITPVGNHDLKGFKDPVPLYEIRW